MRVCAWVVFALIVGAGFQGRAQNTFRTTTQSVIGYLEYLPEDYHENSDKYPIVFFLHGIGERGANTTDPDVLRQSVQEVATWGPPSYVKKGEKFPFILISPQLKNNYGSWPTWYIMEVIDHVKTYLRVDEKRIYLTGMSLGGGGAWWAAQDHPELFAALAPVCGGMNTPSKACRIASENLPVWAFHGDKDPVVSVSKSIKMVDAINACAPAPRPEAKMTVYKGVAHDAWKYAYRTDHSLHAPNVYEWMLSFRNTVNGGNTLPAADAGGDRRITSASTHIVGSGRDPDGSIARYQWRQLSGPVSARMENSGSATLAVSGLKPGRYAFSLQVTDNEGDSDTDYVFLHVDTAPPAPPVIDAGDDKVILLPQDTLSLHGATDDSSSITAWKWEQTAGPDARLSAAATSSLHVSGLTSGTFVFRLTVTSASGLSANDDVTVRVNAPPDVEAGPDVTVSSAEPEVVLEGTASDADGMISEYAWTKQSGPNASLEATDTPALVVSEMSEGTYVFALTVRDDFNAISTDRVTVTVSAELPQDRDPAVSTNSAWFPTVAANTHPLPVKGSGVVAREQGSAPALGGYTARDLEDCQVLVFNEQGKQLFSGRWTPDSYRKVFNRGGLYIYHIIRHNQRIDTGKISVRR